MGICTRLLGAAVVRTVPAQLRPVGSATRNAGVGLVDEVDPVHLAFPVTGSSKTQNIASVPAYIYSKSPMRSTPLTVMASKCL